MSHATLRVVLPSQASDFCQQVHEHCTKFVGENKCPSVSVCIVRGDYPAYTAGAWLVTDDHLSARSQRQATVSPTRRDASPPVRRRATALARCLRCAWTSRCRLIAAAQVFTAVCFMQLVEQGRIGLHDLVQKHLPYFQPRGSNNGADITCQCVTGTLAFLRTHTLTCLATCSRTTPACRTPSPSRATTCSRRSRASCVSRPTCASSRPPVKCTRSDTRAT